MDLNGVLVQMVRPLVVMEGLERDIALVRRLLGDASAVDRLVVCRLCQPGVATQNLLVVELVQRVMVS